MRDKGVGGKKLSKFAWRHLRTPPYRFLFQSEDVVIKEFVQLFVGVIDAELLKRIGKKILETENVQNSDERSDVFSCKWKQILISS